MKVSIVHCTLESDHLIELDVPEGTTIEAAIRLSGLLEREPGLQAGPLRAGVWNRAIALTRPVNEGDRIEIYRPLTVDPKEGRRMRAELRRRRARAGGGS